VAALWGGAARAQCNPNSPEVCDGQDNNCNGEVDEGDPGGGGACDTMQQGICAQGTRHCAFGQIICQRDLSPTIERCNGLDDNCDGRVDELNPDGFRPCETGEPGACNEGLTRCTDGHVVCAPRQDRTDEVCDHIDNDCDGLVDEGNPQGGAACNTGGTGVCSEGHTACVRGQLACIPNQAAGIELCDGLDNDCDGNVDEGNPQGGAVCTTVGVGRCGQGITRCDTNHLVCDAVNQPQDETCNGEDDDCDGHVDEDVPGVGVACEGGACGAGTMVCSFGQMVCRGNGRGHPETCNGQDDDCDGLVDEEAPGVGIDCQTGQPGVCALGSTICANGQIGCQPRAEPADEQCNGLDDDCDGHTDEDDPGGGDDCVTDQPGACEAGRTVCRNGRVQCRSIAQPQAETCNGMDDNCDGRVDEGNPGGDVSCDTGQQGECSHGVLACQAGALECVPQQQPQPEICDGLDNNCDGQVDEDDPGGGNRCATGLNGICGAGIQHCVQGEVLCVPGNGEQVEVCDGADNDCDGNVDESDPQAGEDCDTGRPGVCAAGVQACVAGELVCQLTAQPSPEVCNGRDDDCDGQVDNDPSDARGPCDVPGARGACAHGTLSCVEGVVTCGGVPVPMAERCDGVDNDCDGHTDEEVDGVGDPCDTGLEGVCAVGIAGCRDGAPTCDQQVQAGAEQCDGADNDCDGQTDEGDLGGAACATGRPGRCAEGVTACRDGTLSCVPNAEPAAETCDQTDEDCDGTIDEDLRNACGFCGRPSREVCNGHDDDCNGQVDDGDICPAGQVCAAGHCVAPCHGNECSTAGQVCFQGGCLTPCDVLVCPDGGHCENGACVDPCAAVRCGAGTVCHAGQCVDDTCYETGCPDGQRCAGGRCEADPCAGVACQPGELCRDGHCVASCGAVSCPLDQRCVDGQCVADPCFGVSCREGRLCFPDGNGGSVCEPDACAGVDCGPGRRCYRGQCGDDPCLTIKCPGGETCTEQYGEARCAPDWLHGPLPPGDGGVDAGPAVDAAVDATTDAAAIDAGPATDGNVRDSGVSDATPLDMAAPPVDTGVTTVPDTGETGGDGGGGGCSCRVESSSTGGGAWGLLAATGVLALRPRRRRT
jgi:MYXO-CTERM domain-containing protein